MSLRATSPSVEAERRRCSGKGLLAERGRKVDDEGRIERWVISSEWVEEWM
jgi:hypothetical protein